MSNVTPAIDMISSGMKEPLKNMLGIGKPETPVLPEPESIDTPPTDKVNEPNGKFPKVK
jgi:hypothetical protein